MQKVTPKGVFAHLPVALPTTSIPDDLDIHAVAAPFANRLHDLTQSDFTADALWRDNYALTGTLRTLYSNYSVATAYKARCAARDAQAFQLQPAAAHLMRLGPETAWVDVPFTFETAASPATTCSGWISLVPGPKAGEWKVWVLRTLLEGLKGQANVDVLEPGKREEVDGFTAGVGEEEHFDAVVVGAGQAGLGTAGRLQALGAKYVVIDKNANVGDNWRNRYDSTKLHTIREYSQLPFDRTFSADYGEWLTKDNLADGYQIWAKKYDINVWLSTELLSGTWDETQKRWTLSLQQKQGDTETPKTITCSHVVLAVGAGCQKPKMPQYAGKDKFQGTVKHSVEYKNASQWKGKQGVVVGSANTAHDVAEDMLAAGLESVTMIQRGTTFVFPREYLQNVWSQLLNEHIPIDVADRIMNSNPMGVTRLMSMMALHPQAAAQPERFDALERVGFKTERYGDIIYQLNEHFGGHYQDSGASAKVAQGLIKIKSDSLPTAYTETGLQFGDGTHIPADLVVFATGFEGNLRDSVKELFGESVYNQVDDFWGIDNEGEVRGAYKPTGHPSLWYMGGPMGQVRFYTRMIALQIVADLLGSPLPVYKETPTSVGQKLKSLVGL